MRQVLKFFGLVVATLILLLCLRDNGHSLFSGQQILSICIFSTFIYGTLLFGEFRLAFAFGGIALLMALFLFSLIGIPLTVGFAGKFFIFIGAMTVPM